MKQNFSGQYLETDNLAQKNKTIFVFEGKASKENVAVKQLKDRYNSLKIYKNDYVKMANTFDDYDFVRLFYYSIKRRLISEYKSNGIKILSTKFNNLNELAQILRNL